MASSHQTFTLVQDYKTKFYEVCAIFFLYVQRLRAFYEPALQFTRALGLYVQYHLWYFPNAHCGYFVHNLWLTVYSQGVRVSLSYQFVVDFLSANGYIFVILAVSTSFVCAEDYETTGTF